MSAAALRDSIESLGWPGAAGIALAVFAAAFWFSALQPAMAERDALRDRAARLEQRNRSTGMPVLRDRAGPADQLATFYAFFPAATSTPEWLAKIHAAAAAKGLQLAAGEYKVSRPANAKLARYQIILPVQGSYPQIRGFLGALLAEIPAAVLEDVSLKRESAENPLLEARIRLTLYLGAA